MRTQILQTSAKTYTSHLRQKVSFLEGPLRSLGHLGWAMFEQGQGTQSRPAGLERSLEF